MIDFPATPTPGQIYNSGTGPIYIWDGVAWSLVTQATATAERRNRIVNGAMQVSQQTINAASPVSVSTAWYAADQWCASSDTTPGTTSAQRVQAVTPSGATDRIRITVGTAKASLTAGQYFNYYQYIEGLNVADLQWGTANAKQVVLRIGVKAPSGTYSIGFVNGATNRSYVASFTIAAGQANTDTIQTFVIPGDVTGTWATNNTIGIYLAITFACGTTYQGAAGWQAGYKFAITGATNGMAAAGAVFELFDVGLYADPDKTGLAPPYEAEDFVTTLTKCKRYWRKSYDLGDAVGTTTYNGCTSARSYSVDTYSDAGSSSTSIDMRVQPTVVIYSTQTGAPNKLFNNVAGDVNATVTCIGMQMISLQANATQTPANTVCYGQFTANARM